MAKKTAPATAQPTTTDLAALYEEVSANIQETISKESGRYLSWKWIQDDVAQTIIFLCEKRGGKVDTSVTRQFLTAVLEKKINNLPEGGDKTFDDIGRMRVEVTMSEFKARKLEQLKMSTKSSNSGSTLTRLLGNNGCKAWLKRHHAISFKDGMWMHGNQKQEEQSS